MANKYDLKGQRAVITGGAAGIGFAIASRFIASGATVTLWDVDEKAAKAAAKQLGEKASAIRCDVTDYASVETATRATVKAHKGIDVLVCNAGIAGVNEELDIYPLEMWQKIMAINLDGVFHCLRAVTPVMKAQKYGRIVNIASIAGKEGNPKACAYSASKAGVIALTKSLGKELAGLDIAVNCITPAAARTAIFDQMTPEFIQFMLAKIPRGRFVLVEEIAAMASWLATKENSFTTSGVFDISGGRATY